ncbi:hypothetical protein RB195_018562 [Necator americanus]|uniref:Uncharacterized protein n=1 Tax=Necator americanus TaxID=51031 RepID=A0ABR1CDB0_NECAM
MQRWYLNNNSMCLESGYTPRSKQRKSSDSPWGADEPQRCIHFPEKSLTPSAYVVRDNSSDARRAAKRNMPTLKLQLDYVLTKNIPLSEIRKYRAVWDVAFDSDHRPVLNGRQKRRSLKIHVRTSRLSPWSIYDLSGVDSEMIRFIVRRVIEV